MEKKRLNYFSSSEHRTIYGVQGVRDKIFFPVSKFLSFVGINADMVSLIGFGMLGFFIYFLQSAPYLACIFLLLHVLVDAFDGPLARYQKKDGDGGALVDIICDHTGMVVVVVSLVCYKLINPAISIIYVYVYTLMIVATVVRNRLGQPPRFVFRSKYYLYMLFGLWIFAGVNYINFFLGLFVLLMLPSLVGGFIALRRYFKL